MNTRLVQAIVLIAFLKFSSGAFAHVGTEPLAHALSPDGFAQGLAHPVSGLDPLAALLAAGLRSAP
jgi:urease accessory protein